MTGDLQPVEKVVYSGRLLSFFLTAYVEFSKDQKNLYDFMVAFKEDKNEIQVSFSPWLAHGEKILGGRTSLGRGISYFISKQDNTIKRRLFHR